MENPPTKRDEFTLSFLLKRGTLFGAALGMLAGLVLLSIRPAGEVASIIFWRNCILIGAAAGLFFGAIASWRLQATQEPNPDPSNLTEHAAKTPHSTP
jgi:hypothetical protein